MLAHALSLLGLMIPLAGLLAPALVGWSNRRSAYVRFHANVSLRFQVSCLIYELVGLIAMGACYLMLESQARQGPWIGHFPLIVAAVFLGLLGLTWIFVVVALVLRASVQAHAGVHYRYPFTLRFLK